MANSARTGDLPPRGRRCDRNHASPIPARRKAPAHGQPTAHRAAYDAAYLVLAQSLPPSCGPWIADSRKAAGRSASAPVTSAIWSSRR